MSEEEPLHRNKLCDVDFKTPPFDWNEFRESRYTYVFQYFDPEIDHYRPYFDLLSKTQERLSKAKNDEHYFEKRLFESPEKGPYDFFIWYHNWQLGFYIKFFKDVFEERAFIEGYQPSHKYFKLILPGTLYLEMMEFINHFGLLPIRDLVLELIAIGQHKFIEDISFWLKPEQQHLINSAKKEAQKAIRIIEKLDHKSWNYESGKKPSELQQVKFVFNDETIAIQHRWLASEFVDYFKKEYDEMPLKDWKKQLERYGRKFEADKIKMQYKYQLAKSFYNLLTQGGFFSVSPKKKTPNQVMLCVAKFLEFCLIPVGGPNEIDEVKIKLVRNWVSRKDFKTHETFLDVPVDEERLKKYFDPEFVGLISDRKKMDALSVAGYIGERFDIDKQLPDFAHIAAALKECNWMIGHQLLNEQGWRPSFPEFENLSKLVNGVRKKQKLSSLKFKMKGDETERELTSRLPLYLIEEALKDYSEDHQVEFDNDTARTIIERDEHGQVSAKREDKFNMPEERFMVRFVKSFYDYLLHEIPPVDQFDYNPSSRYYAIIASMLQHTWFFYHLRHPEWFVIEKVKQWHKLGTTGTNAS